MTFTDRADAGRQLAERLAHLRGTDAVVLALSTGGVPVAVEVAARVGASLDTVAVRRLLRPFQPTVAMAAVAEDGVAVVDDALVNGLHIGFEHVAAAEAAERPTLAAQAAVLRAGREPRELDGRTAVVVTDGIVTGLSARAAGRVARHRGAARVVIAAPVCAAPALARCRRDADEVVHLVCPPGTPALRDHYRAFPEVGDAEAAALLRAAEAHGAAGHRLPAGSGAG